MALSKLSFFEGLAFFELINISHEMIQPRVFIFSGKIPTARVVVMIHVTVVRIIVHFPAAAVVTTAKMIIGIA